MTESEGLVLHSPAGGEAWAADSSHRIVWTADPSTPVRIEFSADAGKSWGVIAERAEQKPIEGLPPHQRKHSQYPWKIPRTISPDCRIRITGGSAHVAEAGFQIIPSREVRDYQWTKVVEAAAFSPRDGAGALAFRDAMWLIGGWNPLDKEEFPRICGNDVWSSGDGHVWTEVKPNTFRGADFDSRTDWEGRHTAGYVAHDGAMWIVGGDCNQGHYQNDVWKSRDGRRWERVADAVPWSPRCLHHTLAHDGKIWVMGGQAMPDFAPSAEIFYNDVWSSCDGARWTRVTGSAPWSPRGMYCGSVVFNNRMWLLGGGTYEIAGRKDWQYFTDVWSSADGKNWRRHLEFVPWAPRSYHNVAAFDGRMWVLAGYNNPFLGGDRNDVWYSDDGVNWYELPDTPWAPRHAGSVFVHDNALWIAASGGRLWMAFEGMPDAPADFERGVWKLERC